MDAARWNSMSISEQIQNKTIEYRIMSIRKENMAEQKECLNQLLRLSEEWADEKTGPSYDANDEDEFLDKNIYVACLNNRIIAYALGHKKLLKEKTSYNQIGETAYELDEIYVSKEFRNQGIGKELYHFVESDVKDEVDLIGLIAMSYRHKELLRLYMDELGFDFNHALLVKRMK